jgi:hypothetical protein
VWLTARVVVDARSGLLAVVADALRRGLLGAVMGQVTDLAAVVALLALGAVAAHVTKATARVAGGLASGGAAVSALLAPEAATAAVKGPEGSLLSQNPDTRPEMGRSRHPPRPGGCRRPHSRSSGEAEAEEEAEAGPASWRRRQTWWRRMARAARTGTAMMTAKVVVVISPGSLAAARCYNAVNATARCQWSLQGECIRPGDEMQIHLSVSLIDNLTSAIATSAAVFPRVTSWC